MNLPDDFVVTPEFEEFHTSIFADGRPVFITGNAGTGKSTFLQYLLETYPDDDTPVVLAPTGVAAINVGGSTIHSFFRFPPRYVTLDTITQNRKWMMDFEMSLQTIIIDEISMVRADMIDNIDIFLRKNIGVDAPFAGLKVIMIGDLHQLPPVVEDTLEKFFRDVYDTPYFFSAKVWEEVSFKTLTLTHIFRQKDTTFIKVLNSIRKGKLTRNDVEILNTRVGRQLKGNYIMLTTTNRTADNLNTAMLARIPSSAKTYKASISGDFPSKYFPTSDVLSLKVGAQVMMLRNGPGYCNGTIGELCELKEKSIVIGINSDASDTIRKIEIEPVPFERIEYESIDSQICGSQVGTFVQLPIKLAWAITIHKSQGMTFDKAQIDFGFGSFAHGQTYVALSRCRSLEGLSLKRRIAARDIVFDNAINTVD